jgi:DNA-binding MarR family transcriptional regulator
MPATTTTAPDVDVVRFRVSIGRLSRHLRTIDAAHGLTPTQSSLLAAVVRLGPTRLSDLSRSEGVNATLLSRAIADLERRGLAVRSTDPVDRRAASLAVTPAGARLVRRLRDARSDVLREQVERLTHREQRRLAAALPVLDLLVDRLSGT